MTLGVKTGKVAEIIPKKYNGSKTNNKVGSMDLFCRTTMYQELLLKSLRDVALRIPENQIDQRIN